jgi:hypothetical protein
MIITCDRCGQPVYLGDDPRIERGGYCEACGDMLCAACLGDTDKYYRCEDCQRDGVPTREMREMEAA